MTKTALVMAAGTGGHVYPGIAIAAELESKGFRIVWLASRAGMEHKMVGKVGYPIEVVDMTGVRAKGVLAWALLPLKLLRAFWQSLRVMQRVKPNVVISMGGYIAFPGGMMAVLLGKPLVVHEPGAHAGLTNRVLALIADRVLVGFPNAFVQRPSNAIAQLLPQPKRVEWLGTPVRDVISALPAPESRLTGRTGALRLLVVGGSSGAQSLNELVVAALQCLPPASRPQVIHQAGEKNFDALKALYAQSGVSADVRAFIDDMAEAYAWCDVMLCRSGAITVAEAAAAGVATLLSPLPWFVHEEQLANARFLSDAGAGMLVEQKNETADSLAQKLASLTRERLLEMAKIARSLGKPGATAACAQVCAEAAR